MKNTRKGISDIQPFLTKKKSVIYITEGPEGEENRAETTFEVIMVADCPRKGFDRVRAAWFLKKFEDSQKGTREMAHLREQRENEIYWKLLWS